MLTIGLLTIIACGDTASEAPSKPVAAAHDPNAADPHAALSQGSDPHANPSKVVRRGRVVETVPADSYTYARVDWCGQEAWVAGPKTELTVGGIVKMPGGSAQKDFASKALGRTLDVVFFVEWLEMTDETELDCSTASAAPTAAPMAAPKAPPKAPPTRGGGGATGVHGQVVETMMSGGYTYALVDACGTQRWAAGQMAPIKVGQWVRAGQAHLMTNFESKTLGRKFEKILFVNRLDIVDAGPACE